ncbi:MAG TPA: CBS domain-containing protein [Candidatus Paceibacterota bacterium]|nr:CBS domain-containing protein [Candidatus Paceibacterota bacterium]
MEVFGVMNKVFIIDGNVNLRSAAKIMSNKNIGSLLIVKEDKIKGILTERDILKNISKLDSKISNVMSKGVITIESNATIEEAAEKMAENKIKRLPVLKNGKLAGIISMTDVIAHVREIDDEHYLIN